MNEVEKIRLKLSQWISKYGSDISIEALSELGKIGSYENQTKGDKPVEVKFIVGCQNTSSDTGITFSWNQHHTAT